MEALLLLLGWFIPTVWCYSSGLVTDSCADMTPHHSWFDPQTGPSPFTVTTELSSYRPGDLVQVHLRSSSSKTFSGFLLQARGLRGDTPVGSFVVTTAATTRLLNCNQKPNTAVAHTSDSGKTHIQVTWKPENAEAVKFHATFVQNYRIFWVDVTTPTLTFTNDTGGAASWSVSSTEPPTSGSISSADCGVSKVCLSRPSGCDPAVSPNCYFMSAMTLPPAAAGVRYEMTGPSDGYIAFGFSDDKKMGNDDIYICGVDNNGVVAVQHAFSTGRTAPQELPLGNVSDITASIKDSMISCSFISTNTISTQRTSGLSETYFLLFAHGPSSNGKIQFHTGTFISADKVDISKPSVVLREELPQIMRAHGALMLIAWMTTGSLGMMVARYLKGAAKGVNLCGKDVWFVVHVTVMSVTVAATAIAFILAFVHARDWSGGAHPVLGCLVTILSLLQPIMATLRCGPQHPMRFIFNWSHALNAVAIKALAVAAIFTGLNMVDTTADVWLMKVMGGFVGWEAVFYILMDFHLKWKINKTGSTPLLESKTVTSDVLLMALYFMGNFSFLVALLVGIGKI